MYCFYNIQADIYFNIKKSLIQLVVKIYNKQIMTRNEEELPRCLFLEGTSL